MATRQAASFQAYNRPQGSPPVPAVIDLTPANDDRKVAPERRDPAKVKKEKLSIDEDKQPLDLNKAAAKVEGPVDYSQDALLDVESVSVNGDELNRSREQIKVEPNDQEKAKTGLDILTEGIEKLEQQQVTEKPPASPLEILCDAASLAGDPQTPTKLLTVNNSISRSRSLDAVVNKTERRRKSLSITRDFGRCYRSPEAERDCKAFIASKSVKIGPIRTQEESHMDVWEKSVRQTLAGLQKQYKVMTTELSKLDSKNKKCRKPSGSEALVSPKKLFAHSKPLPLHPELLEAQATQKPHTDLKTITSKFKSSKPNPFENLLRLQRQEDGGKDTKAARPIGGRTRLVETFVLKKPDDADKKPDIPKLVVEDVDEPMTGEKADLPPPVLEAMQEPKVSPFKLKIKSHPSENEAEKKLKKAFKKAKKAKKREKQKMKVIVKDTCESILDKVEVSDCKSKF